MDTTCNRGYLDIPLPPEPEPEVRKTSDEGCPDKSPPSPDPSFSPPSPGSSPELDLDEPAYIPTPITKLPTPEESNDEEEEEDKEEDEEEEEELSEDDLVNQVSSY